MCDRECKMSRGEVINARARTGSRLVELKGRLKKIEDAKKQSLEAEILKTEEEYRMWLEKEESWK